MLPTSCGVCHALGSARLCEACVTRYAPAQPRCLRCALPLPAQVDACAACQREAPPFASAIAACDYRFPWDELITSFKSHQGMDRAAALVDLMQRAIEREAATMPQLVMPIPCSRERVRERGYNPAWELARRIATRLDLEADHRSLERVVNTPRQRGLSRAERLRNLRGAFAVRAEARARLQGLSITLVDDVMTTTATAAEAARCLLAAGALEVSVWIAARTPDHFD